MAGVALLLASGAARAGSACTQQAATPSQVATAADTARKVIAELDRRDAPVALVARQGKDLSQYGLKYSHVGFVVRDHADGRWTVVHLLNQCGTADSAIYSEGLVNFFLDDLYSQDAKIVWLDDATATKLLGELGGPTPLALHDARYNVIARYDSLDDQNSTGWVLELVSGALAAQPPSDRRAALDDARDHGFRPSVLHIPYSTRLAGGLFSANARFTDHSLGDRLSGHYEVVTVHAIFDFLRRNRVVAAEEVVGGRGGGAVE
jgi:hypothetical protein